MYLPIQRIAAAVLICLTLMVPACATAERPVSASSLIRPGDHILGNPNGSITIVDFYDTSCIPCRAMDRRIKRLILKDHEIRFVPIDMPILGPQSVLGAQALIAAALQHRFEAMETRLLHQTRLPTIEVLRKDATGMRLNVPLFMRDLSRRSTIAAVRHTLDRGAKLGIHFVPLIYINRIRLPGAVSYRNLSWLVTHPNENFLVEAASSPPNL